MEILEKITGNVRQQICGTATSHLVPTLYSAHRWPYLVLQIPKGSDMDINRNLKIPA